MRIFAVFWTVAYPSSGTAGRFPNGCATNGGTVVFTPQGGQCFNVMCRGRYGAPITFASAKNECAQQTTTYWPYIQGYLGAPQSFAESKWMGEQAIAKAQLNQFSSIYADFMIGVKRTPNNIGTKWLDMRYALDDSDFVKNEFWETAYGQPDGLTTDGLPDYQRQNCVYGSATTGKWSDIGCKNSFHCWVCAHERLECDKPDVCYPQVGLWRKEQQVCVEKKSSEDTAGYECKCATGFHQTSSTDAQNIQCADNDECAANPNICGSNTICSNQPGTYSCTCKAGFTQSGSGTSITCTDIDECAANPTICGDNTICTNTIGGYTCECVANYVKLGSGTSITCHLNPCPSVECWNYDVATRVCTMKTSCSKLTCGATAIEIKFHPGLFGDNTGDIKSGIPPTFSNGAVPTADGGEWKVTIDHGNNDMTYEVDATKEKITFALQMTVVGNNRIRSDSIQDNKIVLGSHGAIVTTPYGVGVKYNCVYPMQIDVTSTYTVNELSISDTMTGNGDLQGGFTMTVGSTHMLGAAVEVGIKWAVSGFVKLTFVTDECTVTHGTSDIAIVKNQCYAAKIGVTPGTKTDREGKFTFTAFRGFGQTATGQSLQCKVNICEKGDCGTPTCPTTGDSALFGYSITG